MKNYLKNIPFFSNLLRRIYDGTIIKYSLRELMLSKAPLSRRFNYLKVKYSAVRGLKRSLGSPILLTIEPTNICNLKCPICETGAGILNRDKKNMTLEEFRYVLDQFDHNLEKIFLYFMGEPFLNRDAYDMIKYASDRGIYVTSCTNGDYVEPAKLVDSGIGEIDFQIAGMSQEVHETYRIGGNLEKALQNLEETLRIRNSSSGTSNRMSVVAGYILMKHNEHQVDDFIKYCQSVGVDRYNIIGTCLREVDQGEIYLPSDRSYWYYDEEEYLRGNLVPKTRPDNYCGWIYSTATIMANGDVVACCRDPKGEYVIGNVFKEKFSDIWNNKKYQSIRKRVSTNSDSMKLCSLCLGEEIPPLSNPDNLD